VTRSGLATVWRGTSQGPGDSLRPGHSLKSDVNEEPGNQRGAGYEI